MAQSVLSVRMDSETKEEFAAFCDKAGMSVSTAVNLFARQVVRDQRIPFVISVQSPKTASSLSAKQVGKEIRGAAQPFSAIKRAVLFGSHARGDANEESDIDVRLELDESKEFSLYDMVRFKKNLERQCGRSVDVITAANIENENLAQAIEREGIVVYERQTR